MFFQQFNPKILTDIFDKIYQPKNEIDSFAKRLESIKRFYFYLHKQESQQLLKNFLIEKLKIDEKCIQKIEIARNNILRGENLENVKKQLDFVFEDRYVSDLLERLNNPVIFCLDRKIQQLYNVKIFGTEVRTTFLLNKKDLEELKFEEVMHPIFNNKCKLYYNEEVIEFIVKKYGENKFIKRKEAIKNKNVEKEITKKERKLKVLDLLARNGLYFDLENENIVSYLEGNVRYNPELIIRSSIDILNEKNEILNRKFLLKNELEKKGLEYDEYKKEYYNYVNFGIGNLHELCE